MDSRLLKKLKNTDLNPDEIEDFYKHISKSVIYRIAYEYEHGWTGIAVNEVNEIRNEIIDTFKVSAYWLPRANELVESTCGSIRAIKFMRNQDMLLSKSEEKYDKANRILRRYEKYEFI